MPLVEIDDAEISRLRKIEQAYQPAANFQKVFGKILESGDRLDALKLVKKHFPETPIPEVDAAETAAAPINAKIEKIEKDFADYRESVEKRDQERVEAEKEARVKRLISDAHRKLKSDGWDDEGIAQIEALMRDKEIGDYDVAADAVRARLPKPSPIASSFSGKDFNWFNPSEAEVDHKLLMENPAKYKAQMITKFMQDKNAGNLQAWAA